MCPVIVDGKQCGLDLVAETTEQLRSGNQILIILCSAGLLLSSRSWSHVVGEPTLESTPVWRKCCGEGDCFPQPVNVIKNAADDANVLVTIEGIDAVVEKNKFSPVPSNRTWVCYVIVNGQVNNENIRCILYPQKSGTT
jgi:hypothetical protein